MKKPFKYYLHDDYNSFERADWIGKQIGMTFTEEQIEDMGSPFYEVTLNCEYDTETGLVSIVGAEK